MKINSWFIKIFYKKIALLIIVAPLPPFQFSSARTRLVGRGHGNYIWKKKVILNDEEARQQCTPTCEHKCDPTCAPELPEKCLHKIDQSSSNCNLCLPMCPKLLKATRFCRRQDDHDCNDSCQKSCSRHFSPLDYNNAPCIVNCVVLPPQNIK